MPYKISCIQHAIQNTIYIQHAIQIIVYIIYHTKYNIYTICHIPVYNTLYLSSILHGLKSLEKTSLLY